VHEDGVVCLHRCVAEGEERSAEVDVPDAATLFGAIDSLLESENMALRDVETGWHLHVDFFVQVGVEVGGLDVYLMNFQIVFGGEGKYCV